MLGFFSWSGDKEKEVGLGGGRAFESYSSYYLFYSGVSPNLESSTTSDNQGINRISRARSKKGIRNLERCASCDVQYELALGER